jgi:hypothetical protein
MTPGLLKAQPTSLGTLQGLSVRIMLPGQRMLAGLFGTRWVLITLKVRIRLHVRDSPINEKEHGRERQERCAQKRQGVANPLELL